MNEQDLIFCKTCNGTGIVEPDQDGYDGCPDCNYGDGPTGFAPEAMREQAIAEAAPRQIWDRL